LDRVNTVIQHTLADALASKVKDPRVGFVTVTHVAVSADLGHAVVHVSVMGSEEDKAQGLEGLQSARGYLRTQVARAVNLRNAPELHFELDRGLEHAARIRQLLDETLPHEEES
jgi:ribosome-binding factor A